MVRSSAPLTVDQLLAASGIHATVSGDASVEIFGIAQDSQNVSAGDLFCCVRGENFDGNDFIDQAVARGAVAILTDAKNSTPLTHVCVISVSDVREVLGYLAREIFGRPNESLTIIGVTGTNGKTSTAAILGSILSANGDSVRVLGTLTGEKTTPEAIDLYALLREYVDNHVTHVVMEVSSHALAQHRVSGIHFAAGVFTNLGRDHLDYHGTIDKYFAAKAKLFEPGLSSIGIVNGDDSHGQLLFEAVAIPCVKFFVTDAHDAVVGVDQVRFHWKDQLIELPMGGQFTVMNSLAAITTAFELGVDARTIAQGCAQLPPVQGRFESVPNALGIGVVVDYAHTPDGLQSVLESARHIGAGRIIVVFGCGGDRDAGKRPEMGAVAKKYSDVVVVTSDNPRSEDPQSIIDQIVAGISDSSEVITLVDRAEAIRSAISLARRGDIVVIAGKGHEATQDIKGVKTPFSDVDHARSALAIRKGDDK